jgi:HPt (histidine-containing phosphotransfer) domain-containing protein
VQESAQVSVQGIDVAFFARLARANDAFRAGLPATLERLAGCDPAAPAAKVVAALQLQLHTLAGAAVTFGFRELGQGARALEQRLRVLTAFETVGADDWRAWLAMLDDFVRASPEGPTPGYHSAAVSMLP